MFDDRCHCELSFNKIKFLCLAMIGLEKSFRMMYSNHGENECVTFSGIRNYKRKMITEKNDNIKMITEKI